MTHISKIRKTKTRMSRDEYFMNIAELTSQRSTCIKEKVGAILVKDNRIISAGYNGSPKNCKNCITSGCRKEELGITGHGSYSACRSVHAEENTIIHAALNGSSPEEAILYTTRFPCSICLKTIINARIKEVVYLSHPQDDISDSLVKELLKSSKLKIRSA